MTPGGLFLLPQIHTGMQDAKGFSSPFQKKKKKDIWRNMVQNIFQRKKFKKNSGQKGELGSEMLRRLHLSLVQKHCGTPGQVTPI